MAVQSSGPIELDDVAAEFGGVAPHELDEYYGAATGVPVSGAIELDDFYGTSALISQTVSITCGQFGYGFFIPPSLDYCEPAIFGGYAKVPIIGDSWDCGYGGGSISNANVFGYEIEQLYEYKTGLDQSVWGPRIIQVSVKGNRPVDLFHSVEVGGYTLDGSTLVDFDLYPDSTHHSGRFYASAQDQTWYLWDIVANGLPNSHFFPNGQTRNITFYKKP